MQKKYNSFVWEIVHTVLKKYALKVLHTERNIEHGIRKRKQLIMITIKKWSVSCGSK
jgi:hypothetical protein